jgi:hypothetical protein
MYAVDATHGHAPFGLDDGIPDAVTVTVEDFERFGADALGPAIMDFSSIAQINGRASSPFPR